MDKFFGILCEAQNDPFLKEIFFNELLKADREICANEAKIANIGYFGRGAALLGTLRKGARLR